jgi:hypothetical protein
MRCRVLRGCWEWSTDFIPQANPNLVEPIPREVRGCCSCVKHALVSRRVLYQEIISPNCCNVQGCCSSVKHSAVTSRILYQEIISQAHAATEITMLMQCNPGRINAVPGAAWVLGVVQGLYSSGQPQPPVVFQLVIEPPSKLIQCFEMRILVTFSRQRPWREHQSESGCR